MLYVLCFSFQVISFKFYVKSYKFYVISFKFTLFTLYNLNPGPFQDHQMLKREITILTN